MVLSQNLSSSCKTWLGTLIVTISAAMQLSAATPLDSISRESYPDDVLTQEAEHATNTDCGIVITARQDYPRLMLNTRGPTATIRSLTFSPDSTRIYAAGLATFTFSQLDSQWVIWLDLADEQQAGATARWCLVIVCLSLPIAYYQGKVSMQWRERESHMTNRGGELAAEPNVEQRRS